MLVTFFLLMTNRTHTATQGKGDVLAHGTMEDKFCEGCIPYCP